MSVIFLILIKLQALGLKRDDTFSVTMLGHCIEMYIGDSDAFIGKLTTLTTYDKTCCLLCTSVL